MIKILTDELQKRFSWKWAFAGAAGIGMFMLKRYMGGGKCHSRSLMTGKTVIITGANCGIGKASALELAKRNAKVIMACRDLKRAEDAAKDIRRYTKHGLLIVKKLDLACLQSVRDFCNDIINTEEQLHVLINNAGIYQCPFSRTEDGFEMQMGVNHLGHFLLTNLLLDKLKKSAPSRVVIVSSGLHKLGKIDFENLNSENEYNKKKAYYNSKLANNLFARALSRKVKSSSVSVYCVRPGIVRTNLGRHVSVPQILKILFWPLAWLLVKSPFEGCQVVVYCAIAEGLNGISGKYYANCQEAPWSPMSLDDETANKLWDISEKLTRL